MYKCNMKQSSFILFLRQMVDSIENNMGEPYNPDDMLAEARDMTANYDAAWSNACSAYIHEAQDNNAEKRAYRALLKSVRNARNMVIGFAGKKWLEPLDFHTYMKRSRDALKETVRAILSAWDDHSSDPEVIHATPGFVRLRESFDAFIAAWDKQEDAKRVMKDKTRKLHEQRKLAEKFIRKVKSYLAIYLDPYSSKWCLYGFSARKRRGKE